MPTGYGSLSRNTLNSSLLQPEMSASPGRGEQRLEIARRLLRLPKGADVMKRINAMPPDEREELRGLVDWVEDYENYGINNEG